MFIELPITIGAQTHRAFLQDQTFQPKSKPSPLHKHDFTEIHAVLGNAAYQLNTETYTLTSGDVLLIPKGVLHSCTDITPNTSRVTFQIDLPTATTVQNIGENLVRGLADEMKACQESNRYTGVVAYIVLICEKLQIAPPLQPCAVVDHGLLIREFFSLHYNTDIHLSDLAAVLHLSERQTERQVIAHTGNPFNKELTNVRMSVAERLRDTTDMSLAAIAEYVGYTSYAGFWKAFRKYHP